jgi:hypothetical protein
VYVEIFYPCILYSAHIHSGLRCQLRIRRLPGCQYPGESLIAHGLLSNALEIPSWTVSLATLQSYHNLRLTKPNLSIQAFVRSMARHQNRNSTSSLTNKFSEAYDIFLAIQRSVRDRIQSALLRDSPSWRIKNCCPACLHPTPGGDDLQHCLHFSMDGGSSLKRFKQTSAFTEFFNSDHILSREKVDEWKHVVKKKKTSTEKSKVKRTAGKKRKEAEEGLKHTRLDSFC